MAIIAQPAFADPTARPNMQAAIGVLMPTGVLVMTHPLVAIPNVSQLAPTPAPGEAGMYVWQRSIVDAQGNVVTDARVEVRRSDNNTVAPIFEDRDGTTPKSNPFFVTSEGFARFYADRGLYTVRAFRAGLEREWQNVLLGVRLEDLPNLTPLVAPIVEAIIAPQLEELEEQIGHGRPVAKFTLLENGTAPNAPESWLVEVIAAGRVRITHGLNTPRYVVDLTPWDRFNGSPTNDRIAGAMIRAKSASAFEIQTRSIANVTATHALPVEVTVSLLDD